MKKPNRRPNASCFICEAPFYLAPCRLKEDSCCSNRCMGLKKKGKPQSEVFKNPYTIPKGNTPWNKGLNRVFAICETCGKKISVLSSQGTRFCSKTCVYLSFRLPDDKLGYSALHTRVKELYGTPSQCEYCGTCESKKFEWANISRSYSTLDRNDWARLCCQCHRRYDQGVKNKIEVLT